MSNKLEIKDLYVYGLIHSLFGKQISKAQRDTLAKAIVAIISNGTSTFSSMENILGVFSNSKDKSTFYRFIENNDIYGLKNKFLEHIISLYLSKHSGEKDVYLIIDDTLIEEYGDNMEGVGYHYSHTKGKSIKGRSIVSLIISIGEVKHPLISRIYYKKEDTDKLGIEFKTKIDLVIEMLDEFKQTYQDLFKRLNIVVLGDSWYTAGKLLNHIDEIGYYFVFRAKKNRNIKIGGKNMKIKEALNKKRKVKGKVKGIKKEIYFYRGDIKDLSLMEGEYEGEGYLMSNMDLATDEIAKRYSKRWEIEVWYKEMKQYLGLNSGSIRYKEIATKWINLLEMVYLYLVYEQIKKGFKHIKEVILEIKRRITFRIMSILTTLLKVGYSLKTAFMKLLSKNFAKF